jgi:hypothetical protein
MKQWHARPDTHTHHDVFSVPSVVALWLIAIGGTKGSYRYEPMEVSYASQDGGPGLDHRGSSCSYSINADSPSRRDLPSGDGIPRHDKLRARWALGWLVSGLLGVAILAHLEIRDRPFGSRLASREELSTESTMEG